MLRLTVLGIALAASACFLSDATIEGDVTVVGSSAGACFDRVGNPIPTVRISVRAAGDSVATEDFRCGGRFGLAVNPGTYYLHAWVYTDDGSTQLGNASVGPFELDDAGTDVGTFVVTLL